MEKDNVIFTEQVRDGYSVIESELQMKIINLRGYDVLADADVAQYLLLHQRNCIICGRKFRPQQSL